MAVDAVRRWCGGALTSLDDRDPQIVRLAAAELDRQRRTLNLVAASSPTLPAALIAQSLLFSSVTAEGYRRARYHPGAEVVDEVEALACSRAEQVFAAPHANVQPLSGSAANLAMLYGLLNEGESVLSLELTHGGHLSHVSWPASVSRRIPADHYQVDGAGFIAYDGLAALVKQVQPRLVICGGSSYPRCIDFAAFRAAADEVGALLLADISHLSGLVAAGVHPSPVPVCDVVTTSTYKQLCGPRGGLVLQGNGSRLSAAAIDHAVFPGFQGTPDFGAIAAKAVALRFAAQPAFADAMRRVVRYARTFADAFVRHGLSVVSGGTDTHMVLVDLTATLVSGRTVGDALGRAGVLVNKNLIPNDPRPAVETSGIRLGTNDLAFRPLGDDDVRRLADAVAVVVAKLADGAPPGVALDLTEHTAEITTRGYLADLQQA